MRPTFHEYFFEQYNKPLKMSENVSMKFKRCFDYAQLTGRKPKIEDFIGENAIFKGDWEVAHEQYYSFIIDRSLRVTIAFCNDECDVNTWDGDGNYLEYSINRIEELPIEIEFKENAI